MVTLHYTSNFTLTKYLLSTPLSYWLLIISLALEVDTARYNISISTRRLTPLDMIFPLVLEVDTACRSAKNWETEAPQFLVLRIA